MSRYKSAFLVLIVFFANICAAEFNPWPAAPDGEIPNRKAFIGWGDPDWYSVSTVLPFPSRLESPRCADSKLFPASPQDIAKRYHLHQIGHYDHFKLHADDEACRIGGRDKTAYGFFPCLMPDRLEYWIISDTYMDACGNYYRGFWRAIYPHSRDDMTKLTSLGRSYRVVSKLVGSRALNWDAGSTFPVDLSDFLFLAPLYEKDWDEIRQAQEAAKKDFILDEQQHVFRFR